MMAEQRNEQELQALFRKHLPMKQLPPEFAEQLKKQVLTEVAATLGSNPVASVATEDANVTLAVHVPTPIAPPKTPRSVAARQRTGWLEWLRENLRLTPSLAMAGAAVLVLCVIILQNTDLIPDLQPFTASQPTPPPTVVLSAGTLGATSEAVTAVPVETSPVAVAQAPTAQETPMPADSDTLEPPAAAPGVEPAVTPAAPDAASVTAIPGTELGESGETGDPNVVLPGPTESPVPSVTAMTEAFTLATETSEAVTTRALIPTSTPKPTRDQRGELATPQVTATTGSVAVKPTNTRPTATPTTRTSSGSTTTLVGTPTPSAEPTKRPTATWTPVSPVAIGDVITLTATKAPATGPVVLSTLTPFEPTDTPMPMPTSTSLLVATSTPTPTYEIRPLLPTPTAISTRTNTPVSTATETATDVVAPTATDVDSPLPTATNTPRPTATNTPRPTATNTPRPIPTNTPAPTDTPVPTATNTPRPTPTNTPMPTPTNTWVPTATDTPVPTPTNTWVPTATNTPVPTATDTPMPTATNPPAPTPTNTWASLLATIGELYVYEFEAVDPDTPDEVLRVLVVERPDWLTVEYSGVGRQAKLSGIPVTEGEYRVRIEVSDQISRSELVYQEFTITVPAPVTGGIFDVTMNADPTVEQDVSAATVDETQRSVPITETQPISSTGN